MSTRHLRRLRELYKEQEPQQKEDEEEEEENDVEESRNRSSNFNVLMESSSDEEDEDDEDDVVVVLKKKPQKKPKRRDSKDDEEFLKSLSITLSKNEKHNVSKRISSLDTLRVKRSFLREENEIKKKFGKKVSKPGRRAHRNKRKVIKKRLELVMPDSRWPNPPTYLGGGLGMKYEAPALFSFQASTEYLEIDNTFRLASSHALDPETLIRLVQRNPFHTTGLLQLSDMMRQLGRMEDSARLVRGGVRVTL